MVSYQRWTSIVFDVAQSEGAQIDNIADGSSVISVAAEIWRDRRGELSTATIAEARDVARQEIDVR